ncbi:hypothetical protein BESB_045420 [Besnoitia besnoiti]|uniref:Uncharacterized protein n=1 Tax=Besnoitia besnoiti TaxID=94643 RepID=A0A2A9MLK7_BESBE|nr:hypothetical protein BESB_045420 [Besnoitia besnoiti]PFH36350.1 hypothetical protein BESB_045420 [Besnoitia besnoiti]
MGMRKKAGKRERDALEDRGGEAKAVRRKSRKAASATGERPGCGGVADLPLLCLVAATACDRFRRYFLLTIFALPQRERHPTRHSAFGRASQRVPDKESAQDARESARRQGEREEGGDRRRREGPAESTRERKRGRVGKRGLSGASATLLNEKIAEKPKRMRRQRHRRIGLHDGGWRVKKDHRKRREGHVMDGCLCQVAEGTHACMGESSQH